MSSFTPEQIVAVDDAIADHPLVKYLLEQVQQLDAQLTQLRDTIESAGAAADAEKTPARRDLDVGLVSAFQSPAALLAAIRHAALRYVELSANYGRGARRNTEGELIIDLGHPEMKPLLPDNLPVAHLFRMVRSSTRGYTRRVLAADCTFMDWERKPLYALVIKG